MAEAQARGEELTTRASAIGLRLPRTWEEVRKGAGR
jgi:hypothetical protein